MGPCAYTIGGSPRCSCEQLAGQAVWRLFLMLLQTVRQSHPMALGAADGSVSHCSGEHI